MIRIEQLKALNKPDNIAITEHVIKGFEQITEQAKQFTQETSIVNYSSAA